jgi:alanyl-tRNA synthetase
MEASELKKKYIEFFISKGHQAVSSVSLIPENDPTVLFTTAGMHPLVPYLLGQPHPMGKRIVNVQKCLRTDDIDDVGDNFHNTFFEMLGNWSLGDYFKEESISWSHEFLTSKQWLNIMPEKLFVTVFAGDSDAPRDNESAGIWISLGIAEDHIFFLEKKDNWWGPAGETGPCGPDTEIFYDTNKQKCSDECKPGCSCGKYVEIWNNVFMEYNKTKSGFEPLRQRNVDTGMGVERTAAVLQGKDNVYDTELFFPIISEIRKSTKHFSKVSERIIADHMRAAVFVLGDNKAVSPSNIGHGYVVRRLIRRAIRHAKQLDAEQGLLKKLAEIVIENYSDEHGELGKNRDFILSELEKEEERFSKTLETGIAYFEKLSLKGDEISGKEAFLLFQSYGFPIEMTKELAKEKGISLDIQGFDLEFKNHQELSRTASAGVFKSGLADISEQTKKLHTASHLLAAALRNVLGAEEVHQKGSNITPERLRFDFNFDRKLTKEELKKTENMVNQKINEALPVVMQEMSPEQAKKDGAQGVFDSKYGNNIYVYSIGNFSKEICAGPHVSNTKEIGKFKILKEESVAAGVRRIKAIVE